MRTNQASRTQRNRGRRGRVAIDGSWRLKRCGQVVEVVVIGCGSILDWLICGCGAYLSSVCVSLVGSLVRALYAYVSFVCVLL